MSKNRWLYLMKSRLIIYLLYTVYWLILFVAGKLLFLFYYNSYSFDLKVTDWFLIVVHGLKLDISATAYILLLPSLFFIIAPYFLNNRLYRLMNIYTMLCCIIFSFITVADLGLYRYWGFRLDATPLAYLNTPGELIASISFLSLLLFIIFIILMFFLSYFFYLKFVARRIKALEKDTWITSLVFLIIAAFLFLPLRGGTGVAPVNIGSVYFHKNVFANHSAVNVLWNAGYSLTKKNRFDYPFELMDNDEANILFESFYKNKGETTRVLNTDKPDIIIIILESFTSKVIEILGGEKGITPCINDLKSESILFNNFYASGDRSDKGIVAVLSGYPSQISTSIINYPNKTLKLPCLNKDIKDKGYSSSFYYGGNIDFANFRSYFINAGFDMIVSKKDFDPSECNSKWGVHDHIVFERLYKDIIDGGSPFFKVYLTLSSHEPFDVPLDPVFEGNDETTMFYNSLYYTDKSLGDFIKKLKKTNKWNNTLLIITADHGSRLPGKSWVTNFERYQIPMLWTGGALQKTDTIISKYGSQTDISKTLLNQLNINTGNYRFSKDLFDPETCSFAFYAYNNGFGFVTDEYKYIYDRNYNGYAQKEGTVTDENTKYGKAYLQILYYDFTAK